MVTRIQTWNYKSISLHMVDPANLITTEEQLKKQKYFSRSGRLEPTSGFRY